MQPYIVPLVLVGIVVVALLAGNYVRNKLRMPDTGWKVSLIVAVIGIAAVILYTSWPPKQGIDLKGGVILIYEVDDAKTAQNARAAREDEDDARDDVGRVDMPALIQALSRRINPGGVQEIVVRKYGDDQVEIIIPDVTSQEVERVKKLITTGGFLKFLIVANERDHLDLWNLADDPRQAGQYEVLNGEGEVVGQWVKLSRDPTVPDEKQPVYRVDPMTAKSRMVRGEKEVLMAVDPLFDLQGSDLASVRKGYKDVNPAVFFDMTIGGSKKMGGLTTSNLPDTTTGHYSLLGIVMDGNLISAPRINETITGSGIIEGQFTDPEVDMLVNVLRAGRLPAVLHKEPISQNEISPLLGEDTIKSGRRAIGLSLLLVLLFMAVYYRFAGIVSCVALLANLALILALMIFVGAAFSLPGMAGLVLTVGMSVDANVLIFERIREELRGGAALRMAIRNGFGRATRTIVDANVTTLITAIVLYVIGNEQLKAFAVTLICGILMCLFTAIFCSRVVFDIAERRRWIKQLKMMQILSQPNWNLIGRRHIAAVCSIVVITIGLVGVYARGQQIFDIDFLGGTSVQLLLKEAKPVADVRALAEQLQQQSVVPDAPSVTEVKSEEHGNERIYRIDTALPPPPEDGQQDFSAVAMVQAGLADAFVDASGDSLLTMHSMTFSPPQPVSSAGAASGEDSDKAEVDTDAFNNEQSLRQRPAETLLASTTNGTLIAQAEKQDEPADDTSPAADEIGSPDDESGTPADTTADQPDATAAADAGTGESAPTATDPAIPAATETPTATPAVTDVIDSDANTDVSSLRSESDLEFYEPINADTIKGMIQDTATEMNMVEPDIVLSNDAWDNKNSQSFRQWHLELSSNVEQSEQLLSTLKNKMDRTPVWLAANLIGGKVAGDKTRMAVAAVIASLLGIVGYIWIRFQRVVYGLAAVVALVHDVLVTLGAIALSAWLADGLGFLLIDEFKIGLPVVAAFLTIIGYSLNDTIVVFDRIREVKGKSPHLTDEIVNKSINQTLSRTVLTSLTTLIAVLTLYTIGGQGIHAFAFALLVGVIVGTYSSIFVASPVLLWMNSWEETGRVTSTAAAKAKPTA